MMRFSPGGAMRAVAFLIALSTIAAISTSAGAQQVAEVTNFTALRSFTGSASNVNVDGRVNAGDGGGGQFVKGSQPCTDDDGVVIKEGTPFGGACWYRQFAGPVNLAWYGAPDATLGSCPSNFASCATSQTIITNAFSAAAPSARLGGDGGVSTDGRAIVINDFDLDIL